jgi:hypothetical protein
VFWGEFAARFPALHAANVAALMTLYLDGRIKPAVTERFPLARGAEAIARLGARQARGKIVVTIDSQEPGRQLPEPDRPLSPAANRLSPKAVQP